ncbi:MAG: carboxypeptidase regulatory-like domain-containing protein [Deltaproteobacteria bacterium]|jgi:plastocyanin
MRRFLYTALLAVFAVSMSATGYAAYDEEAVKDGGQIIGHVKFTGAVPKFAPVKVNKNEDFCGKEKPSEALMVGKDGGVRFAVGYIEEIEKGKVIDRKKQTNLDQVKCVFTPHVLTMTKGTELATTNSDTVLHNANMDVDGRQMFNFGQPKQNQVIVKTVRKTGQVDITCDSHTHMRSYGMLFNHPYHAVTDETGTFTLGDVPPGKYKVTMWHESWKVKGHDDDGRPIYDKPIVQTKEVVVPAKGAVHLNFELK